MVAGEFDTHVRLRVKHYRAEAWPSLQVTHVDHQILVRFVGLAMTWSPCIPMPCQYQVLRSRTRGILLTPRWPLDSLVLNNLEIHTERYILVYNGYHVCKTMSLILPK